MLLTTASQLTSYSNVSDTPKGHAVIATTREIGIYMQYSAKQGHMPHRMTAATEAVMLQYSNKKSQVAPHETTTPSYCATDGLKCKSNISIGYLSYST